MNLAQAISSAIRYETKVRDVYRRAAEKISDATGKKVFRLLAEEENQHLDYLKARLKEWQDSGVVTVSRLASVIPSAQVIEQSVSRLKAAAVANRPTHELVLLKQALEAEQETADFYRQMVHQLDAQGQELFEPFVDIEQGHLAVVQAELDNLQGLGYWFDFQEFDLESG